MSEEGSDAWGVKWCEGDRLEGLLLENEKTPPSGSCIQPVSAPELLALLHWRHRGTGDAAGTVAQLELWQVKGQAMTPKGCSVVLKGCTDVLKDCTVVLKGCTYVLKGHTFVLQELTLLPTSENLIIQKP